MTDQQTVFDWQGAIGATYTGIIQYLTDHIPQMIGAVSLILVGLIAAFSLRYLARRLTLATETLILRSASKRGLHRPTAMSYQTLVGNIVFWTTLLFFITASVKLLGWNIFSNFLGILLTYLPSLFSGLLIILAGFVLGGFVRSLILATASSAGISRSELPARIAQVAVVMTALIIGIEQLGINITFFTTILTVLSGVLLFGIALAFGLGSKQFVANMIAAQISRKHFQVGQWIKLPEAEGQLLEITQTTLVLDTERGRAVVPASLLQQDISEIVTESGDSSGSLIGNLFRKKGESDGPE
jgi:hypothetical protein